MVFKKNYRKKNYKKNGMRKFNQGVRTVGNVARTATAAMGAAKLALSLINPEFKYVDKEGTQSITNASAFVLLNGLTKGNGSSNRIGRSIKIMSLELSFILSKNISDTNQEFVRVALLLDKEPNGATPSFLDVWESNTNYICTPRNLDNRKRFVIMKDYVLPLPVSGGTQAYYKTLYKKMEMHTIYDNSDAGTIADISSNALYLVFVSDSSTDNPSITYYNRLRYIDN